METKELDRISYALGLSMGNNFRSSGIEKIDVDDFAAGVAAVFSGEKPRMMKQKKKYATSSRLWKNASALPQPKWAR